MGYYSEWEVAKAAVVLLPWTRRLELLAVIDDAVLGRIVLHVCVLSDRERLEYRRET